MLRIAREKEQGPMFTVTETVRQPIEGSLGASIVVVQAGRQIPLSRAVELGLVEPSWVGESGPEIVSLPGGAVVAQGDAGPTGSQEPPAAPTAETEGS